MRVLSFKGYLQRELCKLSGYNGKSLYRFATLAENNARLRDTLTVYINLFVEEKLRNRLCNRFPYLAGSCKHYDSSLSEYKNIYDNYLSKKDQKANECKIKSAMQKKIVERQAEKGISNYRIYTSLNLNPGNINAFLKSGNVGKVGLDTARRILSFVNEY